MKYITDLSLASKRVLIRADLDVPLDDKGRITDDNRLRAAIPTIAYAREAHAKVIVVGHMGRPKGKKNPALSLQPVAKRLSDLLSTPVGFNTDCRGSEVQAQASALKDGQVLLLENLRYYDEEEKNDQAFAKELAQLCDVYINNAFATAHRAHASTAGIAAFVAEKAAGLTIQEELENFERACGNPQRPFLAIFGGAKVSTKIEAIKHISAKADKIIIGGAMANTFLAARGFQVGKSLYEPELLELAKEVEQIVEKNKCELYLPTDLIIASELKSGVSTSTVAVDGIPEQMMALDIGPASVEQFKAVIAQAETIVWNGPMGAFETDEFSSGTYAIVDALVACSALTVVGGGDTDLALHNRHATGKMSFVSTAGGAFLTLLEGSPLPALDALE